MTTAPDSRAAVICTTGWSGYREQPVIVVGETPTRYRVQPAGERVKLTGRGKRLWLEPGETALVPKQAVRFT